MTFDLLIPYLERQYIYVFRSNHPDDIQLTAEIVACLQILKEKNK
jgi:hypothetical protein